MTERSPEIPSAAAETQRDVERRSDIRIAVSLLLHEHRAEILELLVEANVKAMDEWAKQRTQRLLANFGMTALVAIFLSGLAYLGWKGWGGK